MSQHNEHLLIPVPILRADSIEFRNKMANSTLSAAIERSKVNNNVGDQPTVSDTISENS